MLGSTLDPLGALLKRFRKRSHLTQQQLATALGVHRTTIGRWEEGSVLPESKALVLELAKYLHLDEQETRQLLEASLTALTPHWSVPFPRNSYFTGREEILEALHTQLGLDHTVALTHSSALQGLGGIGKTQIALEYAYRHALEYSAVFWIAAETDEQVVASLLHMAATLQLSEREDKEQQRVVAAVQRWFSTHRQWLLIWDNVEDLTILQRFLPAVRSGTILFTTRRQVLGTLARGLDLSPMKQEEGMLFLLRRAKVLAPEASDEQVQQFAERLPAQYAAAAELVTILGGLPLALDQAGAYLEETHCGLLAYLDLFHTRSTVLLKLRGEGRHDHPASVSTTFTLAITSAIERHPAVRDLLQICALLHPDAIPEEVFRQGGAHLGPMMEAICSDPFEWDRVVGLACAYSLLSRQSEEHTLSMHRLVQVVLLDGMREAERERWRRRVIEALDAVFPEEQTMMEPGAWKQCERLLPHVQLHLPQEGETAEALLCASLDSKMAYYLLQRGQYGEAEPLYARALGLRERDLGPDHPDVASSLHYLAFLHFKQGRFAEAEPLYLRALQIREQALGPHHPDVASSLHYLAFLYFEQGRYTEVEPLYLRALQIREQVLGPHHSDVAYSLNNLANFYWVQNRYADAEPFYLRAVGILEQVHGPHHPGVAHPLENLAMLYCEQGKYTEAEPLRLRALQIREQALGPDHPDVANSLSNLADLYFEQGRYAEGEPLCWRSLQIREQALGPDHPEVAFSLNNLAVLYFEQGKYTEAETLWLRTLQIREKTLRLDHPYLTDPLSGLANLYREQGRYQEAEAFYQRARSILEQLSDHPETAQTLHDLALLRQKQGNLNEAVSLAQRALTIRTQSLGETHPKTVATTRLYTQLVQEQKDDAEPTLEHIRTLLKARGWSLHLKQRHSKPYVYATRKVGTHSQSRYLAPLSDLTACLAAAGTLPNARE